MSLRANQLRVESSGCSYAPISPPFSPDEEHRWGYTLQSLLPELLPLIHEKFFNKITSYLTFENVTS